MAETVNPLRGQTTSRSLGEKQLSRIRRREQQADYRIADTLKRRIVEPSHGAHHQRGARREKLSWSSEAGDEQPARSEISGVEWQR